MQIEIDASATKWGQMHRKPDYQWSKNKPMASKPSNFWELPAVYLAIKSSKSVIQGKAVTVLSDIKTCGPLTALIKSVQTVWALVYKWDINLCAHYYPGKLNTLAGKLKSKYEWKLSPKMSQYINSLFPPKTIDRFTLFQTRQLSRYNSLSFKPSDKGHKYPVTRQLKNGISSTNPPVRLLDQVLQVVESQDVSTPSHLYSEQPLSDQVFWPGCAMYCV